MKDEYGNMDSSGETFVAKNFVLESGQVLKEAHVRWLPPNPTPWALVHRLTAFRFLTSVPLLFTHPRPLRRRGTARLAR